MGYEWGIHFLSFLHHNSNIVHSILEVLNMNTMQDYKCLFTIYCNLFINDIIQKLIIETEFTFLKIDLLVQVWNLWVFFKKPFFLGGGHQNSPWSVPTVSILHAFYTVPLLFFFYHINFNLDQVWSPSRNGDLYVTQRVFFVCIAKMKKHYFVSGLAKILPST